MTAGFYWHDYETWGTDPSRDWPCQFAGLRTDAELNETGAPAVLYCRPPRDRLPCPDACLVTGIAPQRAEREGLIEADFAARVHALFAPPGTCCVGYNSRRFDDEVTRFLFYRNLIDPYAHTCRDGNSRWDLIDVLRLAHALRPAGLIWPTGDSGAASFRLEHLSAANGIDHDNAHDALADVRATLALARLLRRSQPRLFEHALRLRDKRLVQEMLERGEPLLHVSARYPAERGCIAPVLSVAPSATNPQAVVVFDLRQDPAILFDLSVAELRARLFTGDQARPPDRERPALKGLKRNACPMLAPMNTLTATAAARWAIDPAIVARHAERLKAARAPLAAKISAVYRPDACADPTDPDRMLYSGGFFSAADRARMHRIRASTPDALATARHQFDDPRLAMLLFRYRARNWPETLNDAEREDWRAWRAASLTDAGVGGTLTQADYAARIAALRADNGGDDRRARLLDELAAWGEQLSASHAAPAPS